MDSAKSASNIIAKINVERSDENLAQSTQFTEFKEFYMDCNNNIVIKGEHCIFRRLNRKAMESINQNPKWHLKWTSNEEEKRDLSRYFDKDRPETPLFIKDLPLNLLRKLPKEEVKKVKN